MTWKKGQSGNPAGRPRGTRERLSKAVIEQIMTDWSKHGLKVIESVRKDKPEAYLQIVARLLPQNLELDVTDM